VSADLAVWHDEHLLDHRRRLRVAMAVSLAIHGVMLLTFAASPPKPLPPAPQALAVELVALPPGPAVKPARPAPTPAAPRPAAVPAPRPAAVPPPAPVVAPPLPAPPLVEAPVQVLPEETPGRIREAKPAPAKPPEVAPEPKPVPPPAPAARVRRRSEPSVGDDKAAMAALMAELGGDDVSALLESSAAEREAAEQLKSDSAAAGRPGPGIEVSAEQREWDRRAVAQISRRFVDLARYRGRGLRAQLEVQVLTSGGIAGEPRLLRSSGDLDFDRRAIAAVQLAVPFPAPPEPGPRRLDLTSEER